MKNRINVVICMLTLTGLLLACKKEGGVAVPSSSLTIVNALWAGDTLITNFNPGSKTDTFRVGHAGFILPDNFQEFSGYFGAIRLALVHSKDTTQSLYNGSFNITAGNVYSLFIAGTLSRPDSLFSIDQMPIVGDSSFGIRFVNLLSGDAPISVDILGGNTLTQDLRYKNISPWQIVPVVYGATGYPSITFEFRNAVTSAVVASRTITPIDPNAVSIYTKSVTLVVKGNTDSTGVNGPNTILVNNY